MCKSFVFIVSDFVLPKRVVEFYYSRNSGITCWLTNCRTMFPCTTSTCYFLVHSCKAAGCSGKNSSHPPSGTQSPNPNQPRPPASHGCKKRQLGFTSGLSTIYCSRRRCSGSCCMTSGTGCTSILEIYSTVFSDSFSSLASQKQKKKACIQKSIDLFRTLQTNVAHSNPNHSLQTHTFVD